MSCSRPIPRRRCAGGDRDRAPRIRRRVRALARHALAAPSVKAPTACASHRLSETRQSRVVGDGRLALRDEIHQPLRPLRDLGRRDCWARAWLRFGRVPVIAANELFDLRFEEGRTRGFTHLSLTRASSDAPCPSLVPQWEMPRRDLLSAALTPPRHFHVTHAAETGPRTSGNGTARWIWDGGGRGGSYDSNATSSSTLGRRSNSSAAVVAILHERGPI